MFTRLLIVYSFSDTKSRIPDEEIVYSKGSFAAKDERLVGSPCSTKASD